MLRSYFTLATPDAGLALVEEESRVSTVKTATAMLQKLAQKYIDTSSYDAATETHSSAALTLISKLDQALADEFGAVETQVAKDRADSVRKLADMKAAADKVYNDEKTRHEGIVAASLKVQEDARAVRKTETDKWTTMSDIEAVKLGEKNAALAKQIEDGIAAELLKQNYDTVANARFTTQKAKIDRVLAADQAYLQEERDAIKELLGYLQTMDLAGPGAL
jgi:hypothetical protein